MCQATVYLEEEVVAKEINCLEPVEGGVPVQSFFEEPHVIPGVVKAIDFLKHRVLLEPIAEEGDEGP